MEKFYNEKCLILQKSNSMSMKEKKWEVHAPSREDKLDAF
jgi:hypothetical protein